MKPWSPYLSIGLLVAGIVYLFITSLQMRHELNRQQNDYKARQKELQHRVDSSRVVIDSLMRIGKFRDSYIAKQDSQITVREQNIKQLENARHQIRSAVRALSSTGLDSALAKFSTDSTDYGLR